MCVINQQVPGTQSDITLVPSKIKRPCSGNYHKLSELMGSWPDMAIFRRFGTMNVQNLLFLQAELSHLEYELQRLQEQYGKSDGEKGQVSLRSWWDMRGNEDSEQLDIVLEVRQKLSEYSRSSSKAHIFLASRLTLVRSRFRCVPPSVHGALPVTSSAEARPQLPETMADPTEVWWEPPSRDRKRGLGRRTSPHEQ
jgi:hypothetical protein